MTTLPGGLLHHYAALDRAIPLAKIDAEQTATEERHVSGWNSRISRSASTTTVASHC
jgi:hypothetical protein